MGLVVLAALLAAKKRQERHHEYSNCSSSSSSSNYDTQDRRLFSWINSEIKSIESVLFDFFKMISDKYTECIKSSMEAFEKEKSELEKKIEPLKPQIEKFCNAMKENGIDFSVDYGTPVTITIGKTSFPVHTYNGLVYEAIPRIVGELERSKDEASYKINRFQKDYDEDLKNAKHAIFGRKAKFEKASKSKERLEREKGKYQNYCTEQETLKKFVSVSEEYSDLYSASILYYGRLSKRYAEVGSILSSLREDEENPYRVNQRLMKRAFSKLLIEGKISSDLMQKIFKYIDSRKEIEYETSHQYKELSYFEQDRISSVAKWFIDEHYKEYERRKEEQLSTLTRGMTLTKKL